MTSVEGQELAKTFGCQFFEVSAKDRINVEEAVYALYREVVKAQQGYTNARKKKKLALSSVKNFL